LMRSLRLTRWSEVLKDLRISKRGCSHSKWHWILVEQRSVPPAEHIPQIVFGVDTSERIAVAQSNPASCCQQIRTSVTCCLEETVKATVILWWDTLGIYREPRSLHALSLVQDWVQGACKMTIRLQHLWWRLSSPWEHQTISPIMGFSSSWGSHTNQNIRTSVTCCLKKIVKMTVILWWDTSSN
jgi:hypothetical protein